MLQVCYLEFRQLFSVPHDEAIKQYAEADIIVGQTKIGWYGKFEQECMCMGKPVISYVDKEYVSAGGLPTPPIINCNRDNTMILAYWIEYLINHKDIRAKLSKEGPEYIRKYHSADNYKELLKYYETD